MPCRPSVQSRAVALAGQAMNLVLHACRAGSQTWALAFADVADPRLVGQALDELATQAAANIGAASPQVLPIAVPGATPHAGSRQLRMRGRLPDGRSVAEVVAVFSRGTVVFQATALGEELSEEGVQVFLTSLRAGR
jgi:hypothetical protein